ncbi:hypothetical protein HUO09_16885 [Vibrio sp. Y2-5]|uniref:hypothetical protein n=1 Tax=Vibrio sp. Y2-5 TaxID=2743977 RepID=UPI001660945A|nr:hypothetical protein [Vibrio sp. Y2-5]MBD0788031.1 hypothetical protein [Vibrio sp. Y2-5]
MNMFRKLVALLVLTISPGLAYAEIFAPSPDSSNETHWNTILGSGSYEEYAFTLRLIPSVLLLFCSAWALFGLFRAAFVDETIQKMDFVIWAGKLMLILTISIALLVSKSSS